MAKRKTLEEFVTNMLKINPDIEILGLYTGMNSPIECRCKICGNIWNPKANNIYNQRSGCPNCARIKLHESKADSHDTFLSKLRRVNENIEVLGQYVNNHTNIKCKCIKCLHVWEPRPDSLLAGLGCPHCHKSKGEIIIEKFLKDNNILFIPQYGIKGNFDSRKFMKVDFYLPEKKMIIEYNGLLHYIPVEYFGGQLAFESRKLRDNNLEFYCLSHDITLLTIAYNLDILHILKQTLL